MRLFFVLLISTCCCSVAWAQGTTSDTLRGESAMIVADSRLAMLGQQMREYNEGLSAKTQMVKGYRLMILTTTDRPYALQVRSQLMAQFPDQKIYVTFLSPYIKLKFGNFVEKAEAEKARKQLLSSKIISGNIYLVPEMVEQKPEKPAPEEQ